MVHSVLRCGLQGDTQPPAVGGQGWQGLIQVRGLITLQGRFPGELEDEKELATQRARGGELETAGI